MGFDFDVDLGDIFEDVVDAGLKVGTAAGTAAVQKKIAGETQKREAPIKDAIAEPAAKATPETPLARAQAPGAAPEAMGWSAKQVAIAAAIGIGAVVVIGGALYLILRK